MKQKLGAPKSTYRHNAQIGEYCTILISEKKRYEFRLSSVRYKSEYYFFVFPTVRLTSIYCCFLNIENLAIMLTEILDCFYGPVF